MSQHRHQVWKRRWFVTQAILLVICLVWSLVDPKFALPTISFPVLGSAGGFISQIGIARTILMILIAAAVVTSVAAEVIRLTGQSTKSFPMQSLLLGTMLVACWLALLTRHREVTWQGHRIRMMQKVKSFKSLANRLSSDWPTSDGSRTDIGAFMAYPTGRPTTLILLAPPPIDVWQTTISAVDRTSPDVLRFQLGGHDRDDWIEWHQSGSGPHSFTGGLEDHRRLERSVSLGRNWYLVRYLDH